MLKERLGRLTKFSLVKPKIWLGWDGVLECKIFQINIPKCSSRYEADAIIDFHHNSSERQLLLSANSPMHTHTPSGLKENL